MSKCEFKFVYCETKYHYTVTHNGHTAWINVYVRDGKITDWDGLFGQEWRDFDDSELIKGITLDLQKKGIIR